MELHNANKNEYKLIKDLYISAFPRDERAPFFLLKRRAAQNRAVALTAEENSEFIGFAYVIEYESIAYLFYLAVDKTKRGRGNGGKILRLLKDYFKGKTLFLARERLDDAAENRQERINRRNFYISNGFKDIPYQVREANVIYDLMSTDEKINIKGYNVLMRNWSGRLVSKLIKPAVVE